MSTQRARVFGQVARARRQESGNGQPGPECRIWGGKPGTWIFQACYKVAKRDLLGTRTLAHIPGFEAILCSAPVELHRGASLLTRASRSLGAPPHRASVTDMRAAAGGGRDLPMGALQGEPHIGPQKRNASAGCLGLSQRALSGYVEGGIFVREPKQDHSQRRRAG